MLASEPAFPYDDEREADRLRATEQTRLRALVAGDIERARPPAAH
jgi:hypothetical protein